MDLISIHFNLYSDKITTAATSGVTSAPSGLFTPNFPRFFVFQVFMEFAKEQENEEDEVGSLSTTFQWQRLRQDGSVSVNHTDSIVHQL